MKCLFCPAEFEKAEQVRLHSAECEGHPLMEKLKAEREVVRRLTGGEFNAKYFPKVIVPNWFERSHVEKHLGREVSDHEFGIIKQVVEEGLAEHVRTMFFAMLTDEFVKKGR